VKWFCLGGPKRWAKEWVETGEEETSQLTGIKSFKKVRRGRRGSTLQDEKVFVHVVWIRRMKRGSLDKRVPCKQDGGRGRRSENKLKKKQQEEKGLQPAFTWGRDRKNGGKKDDSLAQSGAKKEVQNDVATAQG